MLMKPFLMNLFLYGNLRGDLTPHAKKGVFTPSGMAVGYGEVHQGWDSNSSLEPAHDLQEIQNLMLHLGSGTRLQFE